jgi:mannitol operon repressor
MARKKDHTTDQVSAILLELNKQTDRGAAIIAAAVIEEILEIVILKRVRPLSNSRYESLFSGPNAVTGTLSAKIAMGFALSLYNEAGFKQLDMIREVRNKFAHRIEAITFEHPEILEIYKRYPATEAQLKAAPRDRFMLGFSSISMYLYVLCATEIRIDDLSTVLTDALRLVGLQMPNLEGLATSQDPKSQHGIGQPTDEGSQEE